MGRPVLLASASLVLLAAVVRPAGMASLLRRVISCFRWGGAKAKDDLKKPLTEGSSESGNQEGVLREASAHGSQVVRRSGKQLDIASDPLLLAAEVGQAELAAEAYPQPDSFDKPATPQHYATATPTSPQAAATPVRGTPVSKAIAQEEHRKGDVEDSGLTFIPGGPLRAHNTPVAMPSFHPATQTPAPSKPPSTPFAGTPMAGTTPVGLNFVFENSWNGASPHVAGMPNTVHKYAVDQPVRISGTPWEARMVKALDAEQRAIQKYKQRGQSSS